MNDDLPLVWKATAVIGWAMALPLLAVLEVHRHMKGEVKCLYHRPPRN